MGRALLVIIIGSVMTLAIVSSTFQSTASSGMKNAMSYYDDVQARNLGNSMVNMLLSRIADSSLYRTNEFIVIESEFDKVSYRIVDTALTEGDTLIKIEVVAEYLQGDPVYINTFTRQPFAGGWVPPVVRGAWTANGNLNNTISDMYIDGRDHDLNHNIIPGQGGPAISISQEFLNADGAAIGGTYNGVDYYLSYPENPAVVEENYDWGGSFPDTPDEILGYPEGTLIALAQSGAGGGQYLEMTSGDDIDEAYLSFPLSGVTYVEINDNNERNLKMKGEGHKGILVVHGSNAQSRLKGLKIEPWVKPPKAPKRSDGDPWDICHKPGEPDQASVTVEDSALEGHLDHGDMLGFCAEMDSSWFTGLIVTDFSFHHHLDVLGAVLQLSPNLETDKACNGNAEHWVKYSSEAIEVATGFTAEETGLMGNSDEIDYNRSGFGIGRQKANFWFE